MEHKSAVGPKRKCRRCKEPFAPRPPNRVHCPECSKQFASPEVVIDEIEKDATMRWRSPGW